MLVKNADRRLGSGQESLSPERVDLHPLPVLTAAAPEVSEDSVLTRMQASVPTLLLACLSHAANVQAVDPFYSAGYSITPALFHCGVPPKCGGTRLDPPIHQPKHAGDGIPHGHRGKLPHRRDPRRGKFTSMVDITGTQQFLLLRAKQRNSSCSPIPQTSPPKPRVRPRTAHQSTSPAA